MKQFVMGLDIGTGSAKCVAASIDGSEIWMADSPYRHCSPHPGWAEQDPATWWEASVRSIRKVIVEHPEVKKEVAAIGVCGQGAAAVLVDETYQPTRPAILWLDTRATPQAERMLATCGQQVAEVSGKPPAAYNVEPKLLWMAEHEPEIWRQTARVMSATAYVTRRLSGEAVMNRSDAGILLSYDLRQAEWSEELAQQMGIGDHRYPALADCDEVIGSLTGEASDESGLPEGLPVVAGGEDTSAAALGVGVVSEGSAVLSLGTAGTIYSVSASVRTHPRLLSFPHVLSDLTLIGGSTVCGGSGLEWVAQLVGRKVADIDRLCREAAALPREKTRLVFLPYLAGELQPVNNGFARGVFLGADFSTSTAELVAAVMQGTAFAFAHNLEITREVFAGPSVLIATGAPSRNQSLMQTIADATDLPIEIVKGQGGAALGAALLAARGVGCDERISQGSRRLLHRVEPGSDRQKLSHLFSIYKDLYCAVKDLFPRLQ